MLLDFLDQTLDVVFLGYIGRNADCSSLETFLRGEVIEAFDGLVDALFAASLACTDEESFGSG